jgi:hypothetical protein
VATCIAGEFGPVGHIVQSSFCHGAQLRVHLAQGLQGWGKKPKCNQVFSVRIVGSLCISATFVHKVPGLSQEETNLQSLLPGIAPTFI